MMILFVYKSVSRGFRVNFLLFNKLLKLTKLNAKNGNK